MNPITAKPIESVKIDPRKYIHLIEYELTGPMEFSRTLRKYFKLNDGPGSFYFSLADWNTAKKLSKYVDEL